jgi:hypothetical protein
MVGANIAAFNGSKLYLHYIALHSRALRREYDRDLGWLLYIQLLQAPRAHNGAINPSR